jgi:hypothetical protein
VALTEGGGEAMSKKKIPRDARNDQRIKAHHEEERQYHDPRKLKRKSKKSQVKRRSDRREQDSDPQGKLAIQLKCVKWATLKLHQFITSTKFLAMK